MWVVLTYFGRVGAVEVEGNRWTKEDYILRYIGLEVGDSVGPEEILKVKRNLWELRLFRDVQVLFRRDTLRINVKENWYIFPFPYLDVSTRGITVGLGVQHSNFRGVGESLYALAAVGYTRIFSVGWNTPTHRMVKTRLSFDLGREVYFSYAYRMGLDILRGRFKFGSRLDTAWRFQSELSLNRYVSDSVHLMFSPTGRDLFAKFSVSITRDTRDWELYPRSGYVARATFSDYMGGFTAWQYGFSLQRFSTFGRTTLVPYVRVVATFGELPVYLLPYLVGTSSVLRGNFPSQRIVGRDMFVFSFEVRRVLLDRFPEPFNLISDGGMALLMYLDFGRADGNRVLIGGVGAMVYTPLGSFTGSITYGTTGFSTFFGPSARIF